MVSYKYLDTSKIKSSDVVGGANADGTYRGVNCLLAAQTEVSVQPRILIAPGFTHDQPDDDGEHWQILLFPNFWELPNG